MIQISTNEFRAKMAKTFNKVDAESEILLVKRKDNKNMVILPEREYNAFAETAYLLALLQTQGCYWKHLRRWSEVKRLR